MHDVADLVGTTLANTYIIESQLGEGGMGRVYLARHTRIDAKRFAIKVLHPEFAQHGEALERFKREAEATALITSPHVIGVHDVGKTPDGRPFIASDFLEGEELADRLARLGQLAPPEAVRIVRQVCSGLAAAHQQGVVHRDVKPENVFLVGPAESSTAKLLDFGISRLTDQSAKALTQAGVALGTPDFMSPEQARGKPVDHRSDVYAAGVLLYVAVTGVSPFERDAPQESLMALLTEEAPPPSTFEADLAPGLEAVIQKAMAKEAEHRFQSALELFEALAPFDPTSGVFGVQPPSQAVPSQPVGSQPASSQPVHSQPVGSQGAGAQALSSQRVHRTQPDDDLSRRTVPGTPPSQSIGAAAGTSTRLYGFGLVGLVGLFLALLLGIGGVLRAADVDLGTTGQLIIALLLLAALGPLAALGGLHAKRLLLEDGATASRIAQRLGAGVIAGTATYGLFGLLVRAAQIVVLDDAKGLGWPLYDVLLLLAALGAAVIASALRSEAPGSHHG